MLHSTRHDTALAAARPPAPDAAVQRAGEDLAPPPADRRGAGPELGLRPAEHRPVPGRLRVAAHRDHRAGRGCDRLLGGRGEPWRRGGHRGDVSAHTRCGLSGLEAGGGQTAQVSPQQARGGETGRVRAGPHGALAARAVHGDRAQRLLQGRRPARARPRPSRRSNGSRPRVRGPWRTRRRRSPRPTSAIGAGSRVRAPAWIGWHPPG